MVRTFIAIGALVMGPAASMAAQHEGMPGMQPGGQGVNAQLVAACVQSQQQAMAAVDAANRRLELARQTNQPAAMRAAMDDLQSVLSSLRAQLAPCAELQATTAPASNTVGMPNIPGQNMANMSPQPQLTPSAGPARPNMPGHNTANMPAPPANAADAHAGHVTGTTPQAPAATSGTAASRPPAAQAGPARPAAAADPHAAHVMPPTVQSPSSAPSAAAARPAVPAAAKTPVEGAGHEMANMPGHNTANTGASVPEQTLKLLTRPEDLVCATKVDPKTAPRAAYAGKTYYFCSMAERDRFAKAPAAYRPNQ